MPGRLFPLGSGDGPCPDRGGGVLGQQVGKSGESGRPLCGREETAHQGSPETVPSRAGQRGGPDSVVAPAGLVAPVQGQGFRKKEAQPGRLGPGLIASPGPHL